MFAFLMAVATRLFSGDVLVQGNKISRVVKTGYGARSSPVMGAQTIDGPAIHRRPQCLRVFPR